MKTDQVQLSGCGFVCGECILLRDGTCSGCSIVNQIAKDCRIIKCLSKKKLVNCLKCSDRYVNGKICSIYKVGLRYCPIRICILAAVE